MEARTGARPRLLASTAIGVLMAMGLAACTVQLIAPYDDETVKSATALLKKIDTFLIKMERLLDTPGDHPELRYENHAAFYDEINLDLSLLRARVAAIPKNEKTTEQLALLESDINHFRQLDMSGLNKGVVTTARTSIEQVIQAILKAQFALKRQ